MAAQELRLPKFGMQMVDATIEEWLVSNGCAVTRGEEILVISTDKVDTAVESPASGTIEILVHAGETVEVGTLLAVISEP